MKDTLRRSLFCVVIALALFPVSSYAKTDGAKASVFSDVPEDAYYYDAVQWAVGEQQITNGMGDGTFAPDGLCTRAQALTFLWRMAASPAPAAIEDPFLDVKQSDYYYEATKWAAGSHIAGGTSERLFSPNLPCTRAQFLTFLWRMAGKQEPESADNPFSDVSAGSYYGKAVLWAVEKGVAKGTSETTFEPDRPCTRAQVVTFLYRFICGE